MSLIYGRLVFRMEDTPHFLFLMFPPSVLVMVKHICLRFGPNSSHPFNTRRCVYKGYTGVHIIIIFHSKVIKLVEYSAVDLAYRTDNWTLSETQWQHEWPQWWVTYSRQLFICFHQYGAKQTGQTIKDDATHVCSRNLDL